MVNAHTENAGFSLVMESDSAAILGLGNMLLGDDGAGIHAIKRISSRQAATGQDFPHSISLIDGGTLSFSLLDEIAGAGALIIIDAMELGASAGTTRYFFDQELDQFLAAPEQCSVHDLNLGDLLRMSALRGTLPKRRLLVGIQPLVIQWQETLSSEVSESVSQICNQICEAIAQLAWQGRLSHG